MTYTPAQMAEAILSIPAGSGFYPSLTVHTTTGATVTATLGSETVELTEIDDGLFWGELTDYGEWEVTAELDGDTSSDTVDVEAVENYDLTLDFIPDDINDASWAQISAVSDSGEAANYWSVGDTKAVELNGTCGTLALNTTLYCYIIGFDHNSAKEGTGIHFGTWKTAASGGVDVCLVDDAYSTNAGSTGAKKFAMNHWGNASASPYNTNYGGWKGCDLRYDILGSTNVAPSGYGSMPTTSRVGYDAPTDTATSPVTNTLMSCLPSALRAVMKPMTKYTDNVGNSSNTDAGVSSSVDYLPLLAEWEIFGARTRANEYEKNYQAQYAYYANGNSKIKYMHTETSTANWWGRSPRYDNADDFCYVIANTGNVNFFSSRHSFGLASAFCV